MAKRGATIIEKAIAKFIRALQERNASVHTIKAYRTDLAQFADYIGPQSWRDIDHVLIRGYLANLYELGLCKTSVARALAALRSLYRWLAQEGEVEQNPAALVATPKLPKKLPRVPTIEEVNTVLDSEMPERINHQLWRRRWATIPDIAGNEPVFARVIFESLADRYAFALTSLEKLLDRKLDRIHILGGASRNKLLTELTEKRTHRPVEIGQPESSTIGNLAVQLAASEANGQPVSADAIRRWATVLCQS